MKISHFEDVIEVEDLVCKSYQNHIFDRVTSKVFPWYFNPNLVTPKIQTTNKDLNHVGFNHFLYEEQKPVSPIYFEMMYPLVLQLSDLNLFQSNILERMRFNYTQKNSASSLQYHLPHTDSQYPHYNAIYYVNDSDGDTFIFNQTNKDFADPLEKCIDNDFTIKHRCTPKKGKVVIFPGEYYHSSSFCRTNEYRIVLNMNFGKLFV